MRWKGILFLLGGLLLGVGVGAVLILGMPGLSGKKIPRPLTVGSAAPDFTLTALDGSQVNVSALRGKPVVLNYWATWCPPCREEMPLFNMTSARYDGKVVFLAVDADEDPALVKEFADTMGIRFQILLDPGGTVNDLYFIRSYPHTFFIDAQGVVRSQRVGQLTQDMLDQYLKTIGVEP